MKRAFVISGLAIVGAALTLAPGSRDATRAVAAQAADAAPVPQIVGLRRLTEAQYRNSIADIFGPQIRVAGRFEPIVRPVHELIASGARESSISPAGLEQFDAIGRGIAAQVFDPANRVQFARCMPKNVSGADDGCASAVLKPLGRFLFRKALTPAEQAHYISIAGNAANGTGDFYKGLELALAAMLVSPKFLYIVETAEADPATPGTLRLDNASRAARLSFMLWNTTPNETLLAAAEAGRLTDAEFLAATANSMVNSRRFEQGVRAFFADMLLFEKFDELAKDPIIYPYFNQEVALALPEQTLKAVTGHLLSRNGDYRDLFTTPQTYMTRALGALYHVPVTAGKGWQPYSFAEGDDRAGLVGQAGFLALYSHSGRSSPTLRGRAIREVLMCQPVPNPPGNVNFTAVQDVTNKAMPTARIRLTAHNTDPVCSGCHTITDPVGLSLERFDGIGAARRTENDSAIDASGEMDGTKFQGAVGLGKALASSPDTTRCVAGRALEYATGQPSEDFEQVAALEKGFAEARYGIRALFLKVVTNPESWRVRKPAEQVASK